MNYKQNEIMIFEKGDYDSRCYEGVVIVLKDFNLKTEVDLWKEKNTKDFSDNRSVFFKVIGINFLDYLVLKGIVKSFEINVVNQAICDSTSFESYPISEYIASDKIQHPLDYDR